MFQNLVILLLYSIGGFVSLVDPDVPEPGVGRGRQGQDHRQLYRQLKSNFKQVLQKTLYIFYIFYIFTYN